MIFIFACKKESQNEINGNWDGRISINPNADVYNTFVKANFNDNKNVTISDSLNSFPFSDAYNGSYEIIGDSLVTFIKTNYIYYSFRFLISNNDSKLTGKWIVYGNGNYNTGQIYLNKK